MPKNSTSLTISSNWSEKSAAITDGGFINGSVAPLFANRGIFNYEAKLLSSPAKAGRADVAEEAASLSSGSASSAVAAQGDELEASITPPPTRKRRTAEAPALDKEGGGARQAVPP
jgi:hypothetical protein